MRRKPFIFPSEVYTVPTWQDIKNAWTAYDLTVKEAVDVGHMHSAARQARRLNYLEG